MEKIFEQKLLDAAQIIEDQIDAEIEKLDKMEDEELQVIERKRAAALKKQIKEKEDMVASGHGQYSELANEKEFFEATKKSKNVVCHFFRNSTARCAIVDKHMNILAPKHLETRFCKINVEKAFFLVEKLHIRVLPTIGLCKEGKMVSYIIGFDDLGGVDDFSTEMLEWRLARSDVVHYSGDLSCPPGTNKTQKSVFNFKKKTIRGGRNDSSDSE